MLNENQKGPFTFYYEKMGKNQEIAIQQALSLNSLRLKTNKLKGKKSIKRTIKTQKVQTKINIPQPSQLSLKDIFLKKILSKKKSQIQKYQPQTEDINQRLPITSIPSYQNINSLSLKKRKFYTEGDSLDKASTSTFKNPVQNKTLLPNVKSAKESKQYRNLYQQQSELAINLERVKITKNKNEKAKREEKNKLGTIEIACIQYNNEEYERRKKLLMKKTRKQF